MINLMILGYWPTFKSQSKKHGLLRAAIRSFRADLRREFSRKLLLKYVLPSHRGLEVGAGEQSIAPPQTILSDGYDEHAGARSAAQQKLDANHLPFQEGELDYILAEHVLEHLPNAILALREWRRVLRSGGLLMLFMPHPKRTFDQYRELTPFEHFYKDFNEQVGSNEDFHWLEWQTKVIERGLAPHYAKYSKEESLAMNLIHRHVFDTQSLSRLLNAEGFEVVEALDLVPDRTDSFLVFAKKVPGTFFSSSAPNPEFPS